MGVPATVIDSANLNDEEKGEPWKRAIDGGRLFALYRCFPHIIPVGITIAIISLNIYSIYWSDHGTPYQNAILQAWQYAAKAHEILMGASLYIIALHRIKYSKMLQVVPNAWRATWKVDAQNRWQDQRVRSYSTLPCRLLGQVLVLSSISQPPLLIV